MPDDPQTEQSIFLAAIEKRDPAERAAFLDQACGDNAKLRAEVEALIRAHETSGGFLEKPVGQREITGESTPDVVDPARLASTLEDTQPTAEVPGTVIAGRYKLLQNLGEGGMGTVYMAEQQQPVKRRVALKIIKAGMDSAQVIARFEQERQALAMMDHPNIAKVLDAGTTDTGRLFFVMELVKGIPLTKFCDQEHMTPKERLELFIPVCQAVQHAHQKGIIHRDLKPSNVLIALYDGKPVPKVIDFGVAKATGQKLTERTMFTEVGAIVGTLEYMAPEQAELNNLDIDTRADIYSLGVMLYELLTGSPPFTAKQLRSAAFTEMLRMIREVEPPKPSTKLSSSAELPSIAAHRKLEPKRLTKLVAGELDWIVMKCLEKDRGRRYETANGLVMDIQRYLQDDPVLAGPPSAGYRLRKFARRYRAVLATAASFAVLLVLGVIGTTWQAVRAERARKLADEGRRQAEVATALAKQSEDDAKAQRKMAETAGKRAQQNLKTALDAVDRMLTRVGEKRLADIPEMEDERQRILEDALELFRRMLEQETSDPSVRRETAQAFLRTGRIYHMMGRHDEAQRAFGQALSIQGSLIAEFSDEPNYAHDLAVSHRERGELFRKIGRLDAAKIAYSDALRVLSPLTESHKGANEFNSSLAALHKSIGEWNCDTDRPAPAAEAYTEALRIVDVLAGVEPDNVDLIYAQAEIYESLGRLYTIRGQWSEAKLILENAIEKSRDLVRLHSRRSQYRELLARSYNKLAYLYSTSGRPEDAEPFFDKAISECRLLVGEHSRVPDYRNELARNYWQLAEVRYYLGTNKGEVDFREAFAILDKLVQDYPRKVQYALNLAEATHRYATVALRESGDIEASLPLYDQTIARLRNLLTETPQTHVRSQLGAVYVDRAGTLRRLGREEDARKDFEQMAELGKGQSNVDVRLWRAQGLAHLGDYSAAVGELDDMRAKGQEPVFSHYNFACVYSLCSGMVEKDESLPATDRKELAGAYADRAVNMLRELRDLGFFSAFFINYVKNDKDFAPLESHEGFMAFLGELAQEAEDEKEVNE